jgi:DNA-binding GntR family transcriptional regulator
MPRNAATRDRVYTRLRQQILTGKLSAGTPLVALQLSRTLRASRTPVREALLQLRNEGVAVETPAGLVVKELTEEDVLELYEVRIPLESAMARLAAVHVSPWHLAQIEALHEKMAAEAQRRDPDGAWIAALNLDFHRAICEAARNRLLREFMSRIYDAMDRFVQTAFRRRPRLLEVVDEHARLVAALAAHDPDRAEQVARLHMQQAFESRMRLYRERHGKSGDRSARSGASSPSR